jgi:histidinol-phosphate/aromatic aminotransferase/cobyric acid decarboxylase-like protein
VASYGLPFYIRITVGTREQNERLLAELATWLGRGARGRGVT